MPDINFNAPDFTVTRAAVLGFWGPACEDVVPGNGGMEIGWDTVSAGRGMLTLAIRGGVLRCESERMDKAAQVAFVRKIVLGTKGL